MILAERLAQLHFGAQHEGSQDLEPVEIRSLDPFLRGLLFTDGTVSRALEAHTLSNVSVEMLEQGPSAPPARIARYLHVELGEACIRRRIVMNLAETEAAVCAESYVVPARLPREFLDVLVANAHGIGGSLQHLRLESWRELLWFGLGSPPSWSPAGAPSAVALTRVYRVFTQSLPALVISEAFAVELRSGVYRLVGAAAPSA
jgi:chorismate-pyruvate lyase